MPVIYSLFRRLRIRALLINTSFKGTPIGSSGHDESSSLYVELGLTNSEVESDEDVSGIDAGVQDVSTQPHPEHMDEGFTATACPKVQENLKLTVEEQVILEEPASSSGTLSSLQHLTKDLGFGDLFFNDKHSEADNEKTIAETEAESMVSVTIQQDTSSIPPITTPVIDLTSRPESPNVHQLLKATVTETTTTKIHPPPSQPQQSSTNSMLIKRIGEHEHIMANLIQDNKHLEERLDSHGARLYTLENLDKPQDLPEADVKEILHQRMWETNSYKTHGDHMMLYEALEKSMNRDHSKELLKDLAEACKNKKKRRDSPKTPSRSPSHQPPPPPPPAGPSRASGSPRASGSSQVPPPPPPPPSINQEGQSQGFAAPSSSKTAASAEYQAWTMTDIRLRPSVSLTPADLQMDDDMAPDAQAQSSDDEDIRNAHIPNSQMEECPKLLTDSVDDSILRHNVSKPLPLVGPPSQVTIQSDFFFNKDLENLRYGSKGNRHALSISKMKAAYYPNVGLEQMVPDQMWIEEECKYDIAAKYGISHWWFQRQRFYIDRHTSEGDRITVRTHMQILSVVRIKVFSMYGYDYMKKIVLRREDLNEHIIAERDFKYLYPSDFEDLYLLNLQGHLNHLPPKDKKILTTAVNLWTRHLVIRQRVEDFQLGIESYQTLLNLTKPRWDATGFKYKHDYMVIDSPRAVTFQDRYGVQMIMRFNEIHKKDVDRSKEFMFAIQKWIKTRRIFRNLESFIGGRVRDGDYRLLKSNELMDAFGIPFEPPSAATNFRCRKQGRHEESPSKTRLLSETATTISTCKRFAFVRFTKVENVDRLVDKLCTIWLGRFRLHANVELDLGSLFANWLVTLLFVKIKLNGSLISFLRENTNNSSSDEDSDGEVEGSVHGTNKTNDVDRVSESSCMHENGFEYEIGKTKKASEKEPFRSEDPFGVYDILNRNKDSRELSKKDDLSHSPGFTPKMNNGEEEDVSDNGVNVEESNKRVTSMTSKTDVGKQVTNEGVNAEENQERAKSTFSNFNQPLSNDDVSLFGSKCSHKLKIEGSFLEVIDEIVKVGQTMGYNMEGCMNNIEDNISIQAVMGTWTPSSTKLLIISVYAPQELTEKKELWDYLHLLIDRWEGEYVILGDFNDVRSEHERFGSVFNVQGANAFNNFISLANLIDLLLYGYAFTWARKTACKMSKLDRFLISKGFDKLVKDTWLNSNIEDSNGGSSEDILNTRSTLLKELDDINTVDSLEKTQKAKIHWAIEGDENSKYFHDILNKNRSQLAIRGILAQGDWIVDPHLFTNRLSSDQKEDLERNVTLNEIKSAVWDCGTSKSHGSDGFTFEFFRRYWKFFEQYIMAVVTEFFPSGVFPSGCNSSFIALILKIQDAKAVHDFRPISLIRSLYKIITKILSKRLSLVISDLITDVQSAFVTNRQILDGPFILNELLSWCKHKKMKAMFFKVDFEKAFDSIRWDYLDDVLTMFGFGIKWRGWISGCLKSAIGPVLVNGNPTTKFQFHKGLKQGDPLSPFLFILVMESLHLSFRRVMDAGLFSGISINNSLTISNLFYADDVVFIDDMALKHRYPRLYALELSKHISVSEKLSSDSLVFSFRRIPRGGIEEEQQRYLQTRIEGIILAPMSDRWIWSYESSGEFSVKSARSFIDDSLLPKEEVPIRWVNVIPI
uniref:RNA-directed DNA polymerase, eukaryota n=1 Tax=Tanacetum cinerariifolium TaxID=118510 RepID=A0A6L2M9Q1_TANCI|nr:RNA-directed DNA polymerase, eukaryota [Tanacetum cinerariifolium]